MMYMRDKVDIRTDWMEIHHSNIQSADIDQWFKRVHFMIEGVLYRSDSDEFQQALFWERLKK